MQGQMAKSRTSDAFRKLVRQCQEQISEHEAGSVGRDSPSLHKMRVGVRRLRSVFNTFKPALIADEVNELRDDLRWLQGVLGRCRDWDVFSAQQLSPLRNQLPEDDRLQRFSDSGWEARKDAYDALEAAVRDDRYRAIHDRLHDLVEHTESAGTRWMDRTASKFAHHAVRKQIKKVTVPADDIASLPLDDLHELRKAIKKGRYALEFFIGAYRRKRAKRHLAQLSLMQDIIGQMVDVRAGQELMKQIEPGNRLQAQALKGARDVVTGWMIANSTDCRAQLSDAWHRYRSLKRLR
jgi:triphosphatase